MRKRLAKGEQGFSLIELLIVILIIGILAAIALPAFLSQRDKGKDSNAKSDARNLVSQVESCFTEGEKYSPCDGPPGLDPAGVPFVAGMPAQKSGRVGVVTGTETYTVVAASVTGNRFTIEKDSSGVVTRSCSTAGGTDRGGCNADTW